MARAEPFRCHERHPPAVARSAAAAAVLLVLLAGCAAADDAGGAACRITRAAIVPLRGEDNFVVAPATIDANAALMRVDTGAERTMVTPLTVDALHLTRDTHKTTTLRGTGGTVVTQDAKLQSFDLGGMEMLDQTYAVGELPSRNADHDRAAGLIGADWLSDFDVDLDLPHRRMTLYRVEGCTGDYLPWTGPRSMLTTYRYGRGLVLMKLTLDGAPVTAVLDSGASRTMVTEHAAAQAGVDGMTGEPTGHSRGVDGADIAIRLHRFHKLVVGGSETDEVPLAVGQLRLPGGSDMLLGLDWLRAHRVWIDYRDRHLFVHGSSTEE